MLGLCRRVNVRDAASERNALRLVAADRVRLTADMAFLPTTFHDRFDPERCAAGTLVIAPCRDTSEGRSLDGPGFAAMLAAARSALPGAEIVFACHDPRPAMDAAAADDLATAHSIRGQRVDGYDLKALLATYANASLVTPTGCTR